MQPVIRGKFLKKKSVPVPTGQDLINSVGAIAETVIELRNLKSDLENTVETKITEVDNKLNEAISTHAETITSFVQQASQELEKLKGDAVDKVNSLEPQIGAPGQDANEEAIIAALTEKIPAPIDIEKLTQEILSKVPKQDNKSVIKAVLKALPENKASLKIIRESVEVDPMAVIDKILALKGKFKLKTENIDGLDQTISAFNNQIGRRGYLHGGGDTVVAGTGITITSNSNGTKTIAASGGGSGTVTSASVVSANGFAGSVATSTTTPAITISTTITGILQGNGTALSAITIGSGLDFTGGTLSATGGGTGTVTSVASADGSITVTNPNTTVDLAVVKAPKLTTARTIAGVSFDGTANIAIPASGLSNGVSGSGAVVLVTGATLITPTLGVASATTINKVTLTAPATGSTLTIDDGFTLHVTGNVTAFSGSSTGTNTGDQTSVSGNAGTATALQNARTIGGVSFDGTANITVSTATAGFTVSTNALVSTKDADSLDIGGGTNTAVYMNVQANRSFVGYDGAGNQGLLLQGGASKGVKFSVNNATFGSGIVGEFLSTGVLTLTTPGTGAGSVVTIDGTQTLTNKSIVASQITAGTFGSGAYSFGTGNAVTLGTIELGAASDTTLSRSAAGVLAVEGVVIPSISSTNTLTNKRITLRTSTTASSATPTINTDNTDYFEITALAAAITSFTTNLSGTPVRGDTLWIAITDNATARAITWGASFESSTVSLPTTTVISTRLDVRFSWNVATSKWRCVGVA